ncbi:dipeptidase [Chelatococcus sp. GCM10030263]
MHKRSIIVDTHNDAVVRILDLGHDLSQACNNGFIDLPSMREGNFTAQFFAIQLPPKCYALGTAKQHLVTMLDAVTQFCERNADRIQIARSAADVRALAAAGTHAAILTLEGAHVIGEDLHELEDLVRCGVRLITPCHFFSSSWSDSATDAPLHGGLSELGKRAVAEMNRLGIMIDVSHVSDEAFWQILELSRRPVIATHSCIRALVNHPRNLTDEMIKALAAKGGLAGINFFPEQVSERYYADIREKAAAIATKDELENTIPIALLMRAAERDPEASYNIVMDLGIPQPTLAECVDHIDYVAKLVGPDYVCMGSDHGAVRFEIVGLEDCSKLPNLTRELLRRGYSDEDAQKVLGENVLRFMERHDS